MKPTPLEAPDWYIERPAFDGKGVKKEWNELSQVERDLIWSYEHSGMAWNDDDLLESMTLLQEMRQSEEFCCIDLSSDYAYVWDISWIHEKFDENKGHMRRKIPYSFDRLSDAIRDMYSLWKDGHIEDSEYTIEMKK